MPSFLNAVGTVGAFAHKLPRLRREVAAQPERLRDELEGTRRAIEGELGRMAEETDRLRNEVASHIAEETDRLRDEVASRMAEEREHATSALARLQPLAERLEQDGRRLDQVDAHIRGIWERIEFVRKEILFEMRHGGGGDRPPESGPGPAAPRIAAMEKVAAARAAGALRLNLGCGHIALPD